VEKEVSLAVNGEECRIVFIDHQVIHLIVCRIITHFENEGPVRIQYKCLVPIYVLPEMKLRGLVIQKQNYNVLYPNFYIHVSASNLCIPRICLPIFLQPNRQTNPGNI
jgi:hypothetical protein